MQNFVIIFSCLLIGMLIRRINKFPDETGNVLNLFVIYISLPALVLINIPNIQFSSSLLAPVLMPWIILFFSVLLILFLAKLFQWQHDTTGCFLLLVPIGNTSFLGFPMVEVFFGQQAISYAVLYDQLGSFLILSTYGAVIVAIYANTDKGLNYKKILFNVISFPPFIALIVAVIISLVFTLTPYPEMLQKLLQALASTLVPVVMIAVGFQLKLKLDKQMLTHVLVGLFLKLLCIPLLAFLLCYLLDLTGEVINVTIFEAAMPPMISAGAMAIMANMAPKLAASLVGYGVIVSFVTLPMVYRLLS